MLSLIVHPNLEDRGVVYSIMLACRLRRDNAPSLRQMERFYLFHDMLGQHLIANYMIEHGDVA